MKLIWRALVSLLISTGELVAHIYLIALHGGGPKILKRDFGRVLNLSQVLDG